MGKLQRPTSGSDHLRRRVHLQGVNKSTPVPELMCRIAEVAHTETHIRGQKRLIRSRAETRHEQATAGPLSAAQVLLVFTSWLHHSHHPCRPARHPVSAPRPRCGGSSPCRSPPDRPAEPC